MKKPSDQDDAMRFIESFEPLAWKVSRSFTHNDADCDDLFQEICISLWTIHDEMPEDVKPSTYVYRVALNRAMSWQRKEQTYLKYLRAFFRQSAFRQSAFRQSTLRQSTLRGESAEEASGNELQAMYAAIRRLPDADRSIVLMYLDKCSYAEMAAVTGLSEAAVGKRLSRARRQLAKLANEDNEETHDES